MPTTITTVGGTQMHESTVKYHVQTAAKLVRAHDRQRAAAAIGDSHTVARIGRRLYSRDKAVKHYAYSSAHALDDYVTGGLFDATGIRTVEDIRVILLEVNKHFNLGRSAYRG